MAETLKTQENLKQLDLTETQISSELIKQGQVLGIRKDIVRLPNGNTGEREVVTHPGGVVVVPVLPNGNYLLVKQYRYAIGQLLLEFPAGKRDKVNGSPEDLLLCAKRELEEETGYAANKWESLHFIHTAPGFSNEKLYFYRASDLVALDSPKTEEDEFIILEEYSLETLLAMVKSGKLTDAKTICLILWEAALKG